MCRVWRSYRKLHLPHEEGFWETSHYDPGNEPPSVIRGLPLPDELTRPVEDERRVMTAPRLRIANDCAADESDINAYSVAFLVSSSRAWVSLISR